MKRLAGIGLSEVNAVYSAVEGALWELIMGRQIHICGMKSSSDLAERAAIGAGMRVLVRLRGVASMTGVDSTSAVVELGRSRCKEEGLDESISFELGDARASGLPSGQADFVWGEDAWCYVDDEPRPRVWRVRAA